jgi:integrase
LGYVLGWVKYLKTEKLFGSADPLFPRNKVENMQGVKSFVSTSVEPYFWQSATSIRNIFKERFEHAGIEYFSPHTFRHLAVKTAIAKCKNGQEIKAVSQNFGHEDVGTTMTNYGSLSNSQVTSTIAGMDFSAQNTTSQADLLAKFQEFLKTQGQGNFN